MKKLLYAIVLISIVHSQDVRVDSFLYVYELDIGDIGRYQLKGIIVPVERSVNGKVSFSKDTLMVIFDTRTAIVYHLSRTIIDKDTLIINWYRREPINWLKHGRPQSYTQEWIGPGVVIQHSDTITVNL